MNRKRKVANLEERRAREDNPRPRGHLDAGVSAEAWTVDSEAILESISGGVFTVDLQWCITSLNRTAEQITGVGRAEAIGRVCWEVFPASPCESECALRSTLASGQPVVGQTAYIITAQGERIPISVSTALLREAEGKVIGGAETFRDLSEVQRDGPALVSSSARALRCKRSSLCSRLLPQVPARS